MGVEASKVHFLDITPSEYTNHKFVIAFDREKNPVCFQGINATAWFLLTVKVKTAQNLLTAYSPDAMYVTLHFDIIFQIGDSGIHVFEWTG